MCQYGETDVVVQPCYSVSCVLFRVLYNSVFVINASVARQYHTHSFKPAVKACGSSCVCVCSEFLCWDVKGAG